ACRGDPVRASLSHPSSAGTPAVGLGGPGSAPAGPLAAGGGAAGGVRPAHGRLWASGGRPAAEEGSQPMSAPVVAGLRPWYPWPLSRWRWWTEPVPAERLAALRIGLA